MDYEEEIDLFKDGTLITCQKLLRKAYRGDEPEGGWDWPATSGLSRIPGSEGNLHVEFNRGSDDRFGDYDDGFEYQESLSYTSQIAPEIRASEPEPDSSSSPFSFPEGELEAPGMFGKAMRAYGEAAAILRASGQDIGAYTDWFAAAWGLSDLEKADLKFAIPAIRSTGPAMWGGVGRQLTPATFAYASSQAAVRVVAHNARRTAFGENAIVDWPRVKAVGRALAMQVYADDYGGSKEVRRLDYAIAPFEVPTAPRIVRMPQGEFFMSSVNKIGYTGIAQAALNYIQRARDRVSRSATSRVGHVITVEEPTSLPEYSSALYSTLQVKEDFSLGDLYSTLDMAQDISQVPANFRKGDLKNVTSQDILRAIADAGAAKMQASLPRAFELSAWATDLDRPSLAAKAREQMRTTVMKMFGPSVLVSLMGYGNVIAPGMGKRWVVDVLKTMDAKRSVFEDHNLRAVFAAMLNTDKGLLYFVEFAKKAINRQDKRFAPDLSARVLRKMAGAGNVTAGLDHLFDQRRRFWANRYNRNARAELKKRSKKRIEVVVRNQILAKNFRNLAIRIDVDGHPSLDTGVVAANLCRSAEVAAVKRRKFKRGADVTFGYTFAEILGGHLDAKLKLDYDVTLAVNYADAARMVDEKAREFVGDVSDVLAKLAVGGQFADADFPDVSDDEVDSVGDSSSEDLDDEFRLYRQHFVGHAHDAPYTAHSVADDEDDMFGFADEAPHTPAPLDMFDDEFMDEPVAAQNNLVPLIDELAEDLPRLNRDYVDTLVAEHGKLVTVSAYTAIHDEARRWMMTQHAAHMLDEGLDLERH